MSDQILSLDGVRSLDEGVFTFPERISYLKTGLGLDRFICTRFFMMVTLSVSISTRSPLNYNMLSPTRTCSCGIRGKG